MNYMKAIFHFKGSCPFIHATCTHSWDHEAVRSGVSGQKPDKISYMTRQIKKYIMIWCGQWKMTCSNSWDPPWNSDEGLLWSTNVYFMDKIRNLKSHLKLCSLLVLPVYKEITIVLSLFRGHWLVLVGLLYRLLWTGTRGQNLTLAVQGVIRSWEMIMK